MIGMIRPEAFAVELAVGNNASHTYYSCVVSYGSLVPHPLRIFIIASKRGEIMAADIKFN